MSQLTTVQRTGANSTRMKLWSIVVAAGRGQRFASAVPKQYIKLQGIPLVIHSLAVLCNYPGMHAVLVGLAADDDLFDALDFSHPQFAGRFAGGAQRYLTVTHGLRQIERMGGGNDWVLVHDAARPLVTQIELDALVAALTDDCGGAVLGLRAVDAMKRTDDRGATLEVIDRDGLWRALTPQAFRCSELLRALNACHSAAVTPLDECEAMQRQGARVQMIQGRNTNIKITTQEDLTLADAILASQISK